MAASQNYQDICRMVPGRVGRFRPRVSFVLIFRDDLDFSTPTVWRETSSLPVPLPPSSDHETEMDFPSGSAGYAAAAEGSGGGGGMTTAGSGRPRSGSPKMY